MHRSPQFTIPGLIGYTGNLQNCIIDMIPIYGLHLLEKTSGFCSVMRDPTSVRVWVEVKRAAMAAFEGVTRVNTSTPLSARTARV